MFFAKLMIAVPWCASGTVPSIQLNNGIMMPLLSYGANLYDTSTCKTATLAALQAGFRFIWSSEIIGEACQRSQRQAIDESGVPRSEIFLAGTVNTQGCTGDTDCYQKTKSAAASQFRTLSDTVLDMLMLDYPSSSGCAGIQGQWRAFNEFYNSRQVRTIAVSNFEVSELHCITSAINSIVPAVNQMPFNVEYARSNVIADNRALGVIVQAYSPLGTGKLVAQPLLHAIGQAHNKSAAQVALKWILQKGGAVNVASTSLLHLMEDTQLFDFTLSEKEMSELGTSGHAAAMSEVQIMDRVAGVSTRPLLSLPLACVAVLIVAAAVFALRRTAAAGAPSSVGVPGRINVE